MLLNSSQADETVVPMTQSPTYDQYAATRAAQRATLRQQLLAWERRVMPVLTRPILRGSVSFHSLLARVAKR